MIGLFNCPTTVDASAYTRARIFKSSLKYDKVPQPVKRRVVALCCEYTDKSWGKKLKLIV